MKKDFKYIIKRILIGVGIILVMSFIRSCNVSAASLENKGTSIRFMPNNTYANNLNWSQNYYNGTPHDNYNGFNIFAQIIYDDIDVIFDGRYLISFIVFSSVEQNGISCSNLSSNFRNINMTTGNWVQNEISSNCIDTYNTSYYNKPAIRILYEFTYKNRTGAGGINELNFIVNTNNNFFLGGDFGLDYGIAVSDIQPYDITIINTWNNDKANQTIINQNNLLYGSLQQQINQSHQDSINEQNAINNVNDSINDSSIPSDSESKINSITDKLKENQNTSVVQIATFFPQVLQLVINGLNTSCTGGYSLGSLYGTELRIPCINPVDYLGSTIWGMIDAILCLCYLIPLCKFLVNTYTDLTSLRNMRWK